MGNSIIQKSEQLCGCGKRDKYNNDIDAALKSKMNGEEQILVHQKFDHLEIIIKFAKIWKQKAQVLVNSTNINMNTKNSYIIFKAGQKAIDNEIAVIKQTLKILKHGELIQTSTGILTNAKFIYHVSLPMWKGGVDNEIQILYTAFQNIFNKIQSDQIQSVCFSDCFSVKFGYPKQIIASVLVKSLYKKYKSLYDKEQQKKINQNQKLNIQNEQQIKDSNFDKKDEQKQQQDIFHIQQIVICFEDMMTCRLFQEEFEQTERQIYKDYEKFNKYDTLELINKEYPIAKLQNVFTIQNERLTDIQQFDSDQKYNERRISSFLQANSNLQPSRKNSQSQILKYLDIMNESPQNQVLNNFYNQNEKNNGYLTHDSDLISEKNLSNSQLNISQIQLSQSNAKIQKYDDQNQKLMFNSQLNISQIQPSQSNVQLNLSLFSDKDIKDKEKLNDSSFQSFEDDKEELEIPEHLLSKC